MAKPLCTVIVALTLALCTAPVVRAEDPHFSENSASYVTAKSKCSDCHYTAADHSDNNEAIRKSWAASGHADIYSFAWSAHDFKMQSGCVQCHSTTGFVAYSSGKVTAAWGDPADVTREVLTCSGCHADIANGTLRTPVAVSPYAGDVYRNQEAGPSNLCAGCHSGVASGRNIKARTDFNTTFTGSHYLAASGILFKSIGYEYNGKDYSNTVHFKHDRLGINNFKGYGFESGTQGPCIACHMSSADKHSFSSVTKDTNGAIAGVSSSLCAGCHTTPAFLDADRMNSRRLRFSTTLLALQKLLESKGIFYKAGNIPYYFTSTKIAYTSWENADKMGAAFNLHLLSHEPGAYAHNMVYAKRLIYDSIDYMDDGVLNGSVVAAINALTTMDPAQRSTAIGYLTKAGSRP